MKSKVIKFVMIVNKKGSQKFNVDFLFSALEYVSKEKRALVGNLSLAIAMSLGGCIQPWILKAVGDWKIFHHILFCQTALIFVAPWFVKESPRWFSVTDLIITELKSHMTCYNPVPLIG
jgi:hypothetical protein